MYVFSFFSFLKSFSIVYLLYLRVHYSVGLELELRLVGLGFVLVGLGFGVWFSRVSRVMVSRVRVRFRIYTFGIADP